MQDLLFSSGGQKIISDSDFPIFDKNNTSTKSLRKYLIVIFAHFSQCYNITYRVVIDRNSKL